MNLTSTLADVNTFLTKNLGAELGALAYTMGKIVLVLVPLLVFVLYFQLIERWVIGWIQVRKGPNRVTFFGIKWLAGFGQPVADALKLLMKEQIIPSGANKFLFLIAPALSVAPAMAVWAVVPFMPNAVIANIDASLLMVLALTSMGVYGVIIAGWASNSKYAFIGAMRSAAQVVSYEIAMGFAMVGALMAAQSMNFTEIVRKQEGSYGMLEWFFLPLFPLFIIHFIAGVAETNRHPFDVAEGESEIVAGFHVEYSGMAFAIFFLAEYANMALVGVLSCLLFLGGWLSPFPSSVPVLGTAGPHWLVLKFSVLMFMFLWIRASFPRYRYDQIMRLGWKIFIPITIGWIVVVGVFMMEPLRNLPVINWWFAKP